ncbi:hypothetical protein C8R45DRAFT_923830 [Mycena sanguinolenta]|nr:hypothetical protein C8R45DRAFT_923830 [Mycena sanguinolenta]
MSRARVEQASSACLFILFRQFKRQQMRTLRFETLKHSRKGGRICILKAASSWKPGSIWNSASSGTRRIDRFDGKKKNWKAQHICLEPESNGRRLLALHPNSGRLATADADPPLRDFKTLEKRWRDMRIEIESSWDTWE